MKAHQPQSNLHSQCRSEHGGALHCCYSLLSAAIMPCVVVDSFTTRLLTAAIESCAVVDSFTRLDYSFGALVDYNKGSRAAQVEAFQKWEAIPMVTANFEIQNKISSLFLTMTRLEWLSIEGGVKAIHTARTHAQQQPQHARERMTLVYSWVFWFAFKWCNQAWPAGDSTKTYVEFCLSTNKKQTLNKQASNKAELAPSRS